MFHGIKRIAVSFAIVIACYCLYAAAAVPFIEPEVEIPQVVEITDAPQNYVELQRVWLKSLFLAGDWELTSPKILETAQGVLLVKSYKNLPDGRMELRPCTAIFLPELKNGDVNEQRRQAIVMRAPEGAVLQFDSGSDLRQGKIGKLMGGKLSGPVTIRSDYKEPGPHDDLLIHTSEVELSQQTIWTAKPVDFQLGPNRGRGRRLQITLASSTSAKPTDGFKGMKLLELLHDVEMRLEPGKSDVFPGSPKTAETRSNARKSQPPVEIRCRGPFRFDFEKHVASFHDQVDVTRLHATGPSDQLTSDVLSLFFAPKSGDVATAAETEGSPSLQPTRVEAKGRPVIVRAPSNDLQARGETLEHDIVTNGTTLRGTEDVLLRQGHREIRARQIFARPDPSGQLGEFTAQGPGEVRGATPDDPGQAFEARWSRSLNFRPHNGQHVLSVEGGADVKLNGQGSMTADEIHVWMNEVPGGDPKTGKVQLQPDRMLAIGHVNIDAPQLAGSMNQLQAWFKQATIAPRPRPLPLAPQPGRMPPQPFPAQAPLAGGQQPLPSPQPAEELPAPQSVAPIAQPIAAQRFAAQPPAAPQPAAPALPPKQRFHIQGDQLRMVLRMGERQTELAEAIVEQHVRLSEIVTARPDEKPLLITGDQLHLTSPSAGNEVVRVSGRPAYVEARGLTLTSSAIHLDREHNLMSTDEQGVMTLPVDKNMDGMPLASPQPLEITWQGPMTFDGLVAKFERQVLVHHGLQDLHTEILEAIFAQRVNFREGGGDGLAPAAGARAGNPSGQIDRLVCSNGVALDSRTVEEGRLTSIDRMRMKQLTVHQQSGDVAGVGPGSITSWRVGGADGMAGPAGFGGAAHKPQVAEPRDAGLAYLNVTFQREMHGNLRRREMRFEGKVQTMYGPVPNWDHALDPDEPAGWGPRGMHMSCDRLSITEMPQIERDKKNYEMEADGNTLVEGTGFTARAARLTYAQAKDLLVLEGNGRTSARLYRQKRPGQPSSQAEAMKILYWPSTNRAEFDGAQYIDLSELPGGKSR